MTAPSRAWHPVTPSADGPPPAGAYSPGVRAGGFLFVSGQVPRDPRTGQIVEGDVAAQTRQVLENVRSVLAAGGATLDDVVSITAYLADPSLWSAFNEVYGQVFRPPYPTRTTIGAQLRGFLVEVSAIACLRSGIVGAS
ncbi:MAG TPA: Rid family hydrolase [Gemmatimonadaceae bacterium]|nr:Rid family hydrolase [Gemmatimonadaceae bacterium]